MKNKFFTTLIFILAAIFAGGNWLLPNAPSWIKWTITIGVVILTIIFSYKDKIYKFILSKLGKFIASIFLFLAKLLWNAYSRFLYVFSLLALICFFSKNAIIYYLSIGVLLIYLLSARFEKPKFGEAPLFSDSFDEPDLTKKWEIKTGAPDTDIPFGKPEPSLRLKRGGTATHSFVIIKDLDNFKDGIIECDVLLKPGALVNICFRIQDNGKGYMVRLDTRGGNDDDSFLEKTGDTSWEHRIHTKEISKPGDWHHIKLVIHNDNFKFFKGDVLLAVWNDKKYGVGKIGIFNELEEVHIDNFVISKI